MLNRLVVFIVLLLIIDVYVIAGYKNYFSSPIIKASFKWFYTLNLLFSYACIAFIFFRFNKVQPNANIFVNFCVGYAFAFIVFKTALLFVFLLDDVLRIVQFIGKTCWKFLGNSSSLPIPFGERRKFIGQVGLGLASIPFLSMLYGITKGKYHYKVKSLALSFKNLPKAFDGLKIVHISDIHVGSFDDFSAVKKGVDLIKAQQPDLILFTGDLVNNEALEILPYKDLFASLKAPLGVFSSLGNHDYGTHKRWNSAEEKQQNLLDLYLHQKEMGFELLNNQTKTLVKDGAKIDVVGVENWGKPPFPQKGDLDEALKTAHPNNFKILLSHDPTHWDEKVIPNKTHIDLTLSGHTHGMQFGIEIPGFKWSPSKYIYKRWAGLYQNKNQYLYVNRGFGFLGFPGRVGIWPEITVINLNQKS